MLLLPTTPTIYRVDEVAAEPILLNSRLGTYTNFVNLLDLCALALPAGFRPDGLPQGVTLMAPAWNDRMLAGLGQAWQRATGLPLGATGATLPGRARLVAAAAAAESSSPWSARICRAARSTTSSPELGAAPAAATRTAGCYRLYALADTQPPKPGLVRRPGDAAPASRSRSGASRRRLGQLLAGVPPPLAIGTVELADGSRVKGFLCEGARGRGRAATSPASAAGATT